MRGCASTNIASTNPSTQEMKMGQTKLNQVDEGSEHLGNHKGKTETTQPTKGQRKLAEGAQETVSNPIKEEPRGTKRLAVQEAGVCKKTKEQ
jgi:hypothetical protein